MSTSVVELPPGDVGGSNQLEYGAMEAESSGDALLTSSYQLHNSNGSENSPNHDAHSDDEGDDSSVDDEDENEMSLAELLYSSSSYHAIVKPGVSF